MAHHHQERLADELLGFLAEEVRRLSDPRLPIITLTAVEATRDHKIATVYWSIFVHRQQKDESAEVSSYPSPEKIKLVSRTLAGAESYLKHRISEELEIRHVPKLIFKYDESAERGSRIDNLLKKAGY